MTRAESASRPSLGNRREVLAWASYDWANSAYSTLSITILVAYLQKIVFPAETWGRTGPVVWAWGISLSMLVAAILSPILGAAADAHASKRRWLAITALGGAGGAVLLALVPPANAWLVVVLFVGTSLMFELSLCFYNGFLPEIADEALMNRVSGWGYGLGYIGGGLALVAAMLLLEFGDRIGITDRVLQVRLSLLIMGLWWGLFSLPALIVLRDRGGAKQPVRQSTRSALGEVMHTLRNLQSYRMLAMFLLGFLFYNDGIQTVISQSATFAITDLHFTDIELIGVVLMIQFLAAPGALLVSALADRFGQKPTLLACLVIWMAMLAVAFFIQTKGQFWVLGVVLALVLGGTQSVSRAVMGVMTPPARTAEFFGFFNLSGKATSFLGTFLFGLIVYHTGSARLAILSLLVFFLIGLALVAGIDVRRGQKEAAQS